MWHSTPVVTSPTSWRPKKNSKVVPPWPPPAQLSLRAGAAVAPVIPGEGTCAPHLREHVVLLGQFPNDFKVIHIVEFFE